MATTGLWPIKASLRNVLEYAGNPEKTTEGKCNGDDLDNVIDYIFNDDKTDRKMFVSGINCVPELAYETMTGTKKRFGKEGGNVAYHGYQSFENGEVTAEEAHRIGIETAERLWGEEYEVLVTTHLNTDNIHNHIVINSVSFRTGKKFKNRIADHLSMREISDQVCREHHKNVIGDAPFFRSEKKEYWLHKAGKITRRDMLRKDIDYAVSSSSNMKAFESILKSMGYRFARGREYVHPSIKAEGWERAVRLDSLGKGYSYDELYDRVGEGDKPYTLYQTAYFRYKGRPMRDMLSSMKDPRYMSGARVAVILITELLKLVTGNNIADERSHPSSPEIRAACAYLDRYTRGLDLMNRYDLSTDEDIARFIVERDEKINGLYDERKKVNNRIRRCGNEDDLERLKKERSRITAELYPLRKEFRTAKDILVSLPQIRELLNRELEVEDSRMNRKRVR